MPAGRSQGDYEHLPFGRRRSMVLASGYAARESSGADAIGATFGTARATDGLVRLDHHRFTPDFASRGYQRLGPDCGWHSPGGSGRKDREAAVKAGIGSAEPTEVVGCGAERL